MSSKDRRARAARQTKQKRIRAITFGAIVLLVLGTAGYFLTSALWPKVPVAAANTIDISAGMDGFNMKEIRVKVGKPITIRLTSLDTQFHTDGGGKHQWAVDEFGASVIAPPEGSNTVTFTPTKTGSYLYYCDICFGGRANPSMQGKLIVEEA